MILTSDYYIVKLTHHHLYNNNFLFNYKICYVLTFNPDKKTNSISMFDYLIDGKLLKISNTT